MSCATTRVKLEDLILSKIGQSQKKANTVKLIETDVEWWLGVEGNGEMFLTGREFQICKMKKFGRSVSQ